MTLPWFLPWFLHGVEKPFKVVMIHRSTMSLVLGTMTIFLRRTLDDLRQSMGP